MAEKLTPQQEQAVHNRGGMLLVSAAAGSGKTKVLVDRLMEYLTDPVNPANLDDFLIITYTKAAAAELRGKIGAKLAERIAQEPENRHLQRQVQRLYLAKISTVHSFCADILREYAYRLDIPADFRVADENECRQLRDTVMEQVLEEAYSRAVEDPDFCAFVDTQGLGRDDRMVPEILLKVYDNARCHMDPQLWLEDCVSRADVPELVDAGQTVWGRCLMEGLFSCLDLHIAAMGTCAARAEAVPELEKPAALLRDNLFQLQHLRESQTWDQIVERRNLAYGTLRFPKNNPDPELAERIKAVRDGCKKGVEKRLRAFSDPTERIREDLCQSAGAVRGMVGLVRAFDRAYIRAKRSRRVLDFSDLEHKTLDLFLGASRSGPTQAAREVGQRFREVLVDEYQDSNGVQDAIFSALTRERNNCFMVGDVKQSIYQFRLADPGIFLKKYREYGPAETARPGEGRKVLLSSNFRSGGGVLSAVNDVFRLCMTPAVGGLVYGDGEALREGIPHVPLGEPEVELHVLEAREDAGEEEAAFVAGRIARLLDGTHMVRQGEALRPIVPEDIVILLRSPGSSAQDFRRALAARGIRCASGGGVNLLETAEVGTLRALLQTVANPRQDIPLLAVLASPVFGFTADELAALRKGNKKVPIFEGILQGNTEKCRNFRNILEILRREARMKRLPELLECALRLTRMDSVYGAMPGGEARLENLRVFYQYAADYDAGGGRDLGQFLEHLTAMEEKGLNTASENTDSGCVTIMSIHKSKGLEFPVVFLCGLSREFNRESQKALVLCDRELGLGLSAVDEKNRIRYPTIAKRAIAAKMEEESLSEELRVLYVAMTRARDRLFMTYASKGLEKQLADIALRLDFGGSELLSREAVCPGDWVLMAAMTRTEAGELFRLGGRPQKVSVSDSPWLIRVAQQEAEPPSPAGQETAVGTGVPEALVERLRRSLEFRYAHVPATQAPSKQTATQRKGREKDQEAAENAREPRPEVRSWRKPAFRDQTTRGKDYGSAIHTVLQHIRYEACADEVGVRDEVERLVAAGCVSPEQGKMVDCRRLARFFETSVGRKLRAGGEALREFKFSILDDGSRYGDGLEGEQVLLQGVVDCALLEPEGITVVDFKTDHVTEQTLPAVAARYRPQVEVYAEALARIYEKKVMHRYLYFFRLDRLVEV